MAYRPLQEVAGDQSACCIMNKGAAPEFVFQPEGAARSQGRTSESLSPDTQAMLDSFQLAVTKTLERERRLGHYVVQWSGDAPVLIGEDAPAYEPVPREPVGGN